MKNLLLVLLSICILPSCENKNGSGNVERQDRKVGEFNAVDVGGSFNVTIKQGNSYKLRIDADDNILEDIETEVSEGILSIEYRNGVNINNADIKIYLETPLLKSIEASASASVKVEGVLNSDKTIHFEASSSATIQAAIDAPSARVDANSSGKIVLKGRTKNLDAEASSAGSIEAKELLSETTRAEASSGASIQVHASLKLEGEASSGASVSYRGDPTVSKEENSGGSVSKID
ncbi:MAG: DUF2807 domain-containing protein [Rhizobacter sp.]|nr:DUF2807 domain-containing protein [Ferruginibacter sp.]